MSDDYAELYRKALQGLASATEEYMSAEPDMPSYADSVAALEDALETAKAILESAAAR